jgi:hypothetical protein
MWQAVLEFANAHRHDAGDGAFNMFYDNHALLDIFTSNPNKGMRFGRHAIIETRPIVQLGSATPPQDVDVIWKLPPNLFDDYRTFSREAWWPVNMFTRWFEEELLPAVWSWHHQDRRTAWQKVRRISHVVPDFIPERWWYIRRAPLLERRQPKTRESLQAALEALRSHCSLREGTYSGESMRCVDVGLLRLLECAKLTHWGYVRSKGDFAGETHEEMVTEIRSRIAGPYEEMSLTGLEWRLRTFKEICVASEGHINVSDIEAVWQELAPLAREADRHNERLAHRILPANVYPK